MRNYSITSEKDVVSCDAEFVRFFGHTPGQAVDQRTRESDCIHPGLQPGNGKPVGRHGGEDLVL